MNQAEWFFCYGPLTGLIGGVLLGFLVPGI